MKWYSSIGISYLILITIGTNFSFIYEDINNFNFNDKNDKVFITLKLIFYKLKYQKDAKIKQNEQ